MRTHSERIANVVQRQCYVAMLSVSVSSDAYRRGKVKSEKRYLVRSPNAFVLDSAEFGNWGCL